MTTEEKETPKERVCPCYSDGQCAYLESRPGTAHKKCAFNWIKATNDGIGFKLNYQINQWSRLFPMDFDPRWMNVCDRFTKERDPDYVYEATALEEVFAILGSVGRI